LLEEDADVIYGVQGTRKGGPFERLSGYVFYKTVNFLSNQRVPENLITARIMKKEYVESLVSHKERELYLGGLLVITGFKQIPIVVPKHSRGESSYTLRTKIYDAVNAVTSFSNKPLIFIFYIGVAIMAVTVPYVTYLIITWLMGSIVPGFTSIVASIWLLGGFTISMLGVIGIYLSKIFTEVKNRPYSIVRKEWDHSITGL